MQRLTAAARSDRGRAQALGLIPYADWTEARRLQSATTEMRMLVEQGFEIQHMIDPHEILSRAKRGLRLSGDELRAVGVTIIAADAAVRGVRSGHAPTLSALTDSLRSMRELGESLCATFDVRGEIIDRASPSLLQARQQCLQAIDDARTLCLKLMRNSRIAKALQDTAITLRDQRFVLSVRADQATLVPGIVHDTSASGQTLFVEPFSLVEKNNRIRTARMQEQREIDDILTRASARIAAETGSLMHLMNIVTELDLAYARACLANAMQAESPLLLEHPGLHLRSARHPLLGTDAVPQTIELNDSTRLLIVSGPNMGGKTVAMKLTGLAVLMAACGMHLPAERGTAIGAFTQVHADIGDAQSLINHTSTFAAHLRRLRNLMRCADTHMLFIIDEIASGTESSAGAALAIAVLEHLLERGARGIVTTHAEQLKRYAQHSAQVKNAGMRFAPGTHQPTFEFDVGVPGRSLALDLAAREGFPQNILDRAQASMGEQETDIDRALAELSSARAELSQSERHVSEMQRRQFDERHAFDLEYARFQREREAFFLQADGLLQAALNDFISELQRRPSQSDGRFRRSQADLLARTSAELRNRLGDAAQEKKIATSAALSAGMRIRIPKWGTEATIVESNKEAVVVIIGSMRMTLSPSDIETIPNQKQIAPRSNGINAEEELAVIATVPIECDVRGQRYAQAELVVEQWLDRALRAGMVQLRLIHGKGSGALGNGLQRMLKAHQAVADIRYGAEGEGGTGVTMITLR